MLFAFHSDAGVYVPTLAEAIMWAEGNGTYKGAPLKGIAVGNGCAGNEIGSCGGQRDQYDTEYLVQTPFVDPALKTKILSECDWSKNSPSVKVPPCRESINLAVLCFANLTIHPAAL